MYLIELMNARHMSRTDLSDLSGVPESTLRDILTGKAQLDRCEAATLYSIAEALDVSIEDILLSYWDELEEANAPDTFAVHEEGTLMPFYLLVDATLSKLHKEGDLAVIRHIRANEWIEQFWDGGLYRAALFLLGLTEPVTGFSLGLTICAGETVSSQIPSLTPAEMRVWTGRCMLCGRWKKTTTPAPLRKPAAMPRTMRFPSLRASIST